MIRGDWAQSACYISKEKLSKGVSNQVDPDKLPPELHHLEKLRYIANMIIMDGFIGLPATDD